MSGVSKKNWTDRHQPLEVEAGRRWSEAAGVRGNAAVVAISASRSSPT